MRKNNSKKTGIFGKILKGIGKTVGTFLLVAVLSLLIFACIFAVYIKTDLSQQADLTVQDFTLNQTSIIYYEDKETGQWKELQKLYDEENRIWVSYEEIPEDLINACIAIEDKRFYEHKGVDWVTTGKASLRLFLGSGGAGGSTITQQLIKNLTGEQEITIRRKIVEIFRALDFETTHTKPQIMELYLNVIYLGQGCNGVRSASQVYFGKDVSALTVAEWASLVGLTNNPSLYDPYLNPENNRRRQVIILDQMLEQGMITQQEHDEALAQKLVLANEKTKEETQEDKNETRASYYSYFVDQVVRDVIDDLAKQGGYSESIAEKMLYCGGYKIYCTMDPEIQQQMESVYEDTANVPSTTSSQQLQSAMVVIDNASGDVVGIVGGVGKKTGSLVLSRATQSKLSPGSAIKPITVYAPALDMGLITPASAYDDAPFTFNGSVPYPKNQNGSYRGIVSVNFAVGQSLNTIPIRLVDQMTPEYVFEFAKEKMGLSTLVSNVEIGGKTFTDVALAPLSMGGLTEGITVRDLTNAYAALANEGYYRSARTYTKILGPDDKVVLENEQKKHTAVSAKAAWYMTYMLNNATISGTSTKARLEGIDVAAKTGTTTSDHDRWFAAYTPYYTAAVWCGFDDPEEIHVTSTSTNPSLYMWKQVMEPIHAELEPREFKQPDEVVKVSYCMDSGLVATAACTADPRGSRVTSGLLFAEDAPSRSCDVHVSVEVCAESGLLQNEFCPSYDCGTRFIGLLDLSRRLQIEGYDKILENEERKNMVGDQQYSMELEECDVHTAPPAAPEVPAVPEVPSVQEDPNAEGSTDAETQMPETSASQETTTPETSADAAE